MSNIVNHTPSAALKLLITAGPTHEPIDAVRFIGNRSSGRLGVALADAAAARGWPVTLLLGPTAIGPAHPGVQLRRFQTTADLQALLEAEWPAHDALIMSAAVSDYRPRTPAVPGAKLSRGADGLTLELESTPDLLAECSRARRPGQVLIGFALEPEDRLLDSAQRKLTRKAVDMIVANPLGTMDSPTITATVLSVDGSREQAPPQLAKEAFAGWLLDRVERLRSRLATH